MSQCNNPVPGNGRACALPREHEEPCKPDIICDMCGGSVSFDTGNRRCKACSRKYGKETIKMDENVIKAVTAWREIHDKISEYEPILKPLIEEEARLRKVVLAVMFPDGSENHEGTNNVQIWPGWILKAVVKISRNVDEAALPAVREQLMKIGISGDTLVRLKPELALKAYRELDKETRKIFDQCLVIKLATPTVQLLQDEPS